MDEAADGADEANADADEAIAADDEANDADDEAAAVVEVSFWRVPSGGRHAAGFGLLSRMSLIVARLQRLMESNQYRNAVVSRASWYFLEVLPVAV